MSYQLIYGYVESDDENDDEIDKNSNLHFKDKGSKNLFHPIPHRHGMRWISL